ncbi:hypothetical protein QFZ62_000703 [Clavibacter sp. B3I6]|nr:hypothetical protein [Clavibacter sp. B3I6]
MPQITHAGVSYALRPDAEWRSDADGYARLTLEA